MSAMPWLIVLALLHAANAQSPVTKVIQMLTDMKATGAKELATEADVYEKYARFVRGRSQELGFEITTAKAKIEELVATITKAEADIHVLAGQINANEGQTAELEADQKAATELRDSEHAEFTDSQTSYTESLYALDRAIQMLQAQDYDRPQALALLQKMATGTKGMHRVLAALELVQLSERSSQDPAGAPAVAAYEFQSSGISEMLKNLQIKFKDELGVLEKEESNSAHAYEMSKIHIANTLENLKSEHAALIESKTRLAGEASAAKGELVDQRANLAEADAALKEMKATFASKEATYKDNQEVRKDELAAIGKAIEILSNPDVSASYATHINSLVQVFPHTPKAGTALLQTLVAKATVKEAATLGQQALRESTARYLRGRADALKSTVLATVAQQIKENPFAKVIDLIQNLLEKLKEDAASEADHKAFCDAELRKNKMKRKEGEATSARLQAEIEEKAMVITEMGKDIATLLQEQTDLRKAVAEATAQRGEEKAANLIAIKDAEAGGIALKQAVAVLKEFYSQHGGALLQVKKQVPEMAAYNGMQGKNVGVVGMLEVIQTDFLRLETDTRAEESAAAAAYTKFSAESEATLEMKHKAEFKLSMHKDQTEFEQSQLQKDLDATLEQLKMANLYYEELKPQCVEVNVSFKERAGRRAEEIEALKQAYHALDSRGQ